MGIQIVNEALVKQIEQIATQEHLSPEQVIAEALQLYKEKLQGSRPASFLLAVAGMGRSGQTDVADRAEEILKTEIDPKRGWSLKKDESSAG